MSQMGRVIKAVNSLFRQRDEQILAEKRDPTLFAAVVVFKAAIDDFERREKEKILNNNKRNDVGRVQLIEQGTRKIDAVEKVNSPRN